LTNFFRDFFPSFAEDLSFFNDDQTTIDNTLFLAPLFSRAMKPQPCPDPRLSDLPLWRLLVALDDVERAVGPQSQTARTLARAVQERLRSRGRHPRTEAGDEE
jgi:hypothetical protein